MSTEANDLFRIDSMTLKNFRCFEERTIEFAPQFNVLIGDNGKGKTTVLDGLTQALTCSVEVIVRGGVASNPTSEADVRIVPFPALGLYHTEPQFPSNVMVSGVLAGHEIAWSTGRDGPAEGESMDIAMLGPPASGLRDAVSRGDDAHVPVVAAFKAERQWQHGPRPAGEVLLEGGAPVGSRMRGYSGWSQPTDTADALVTWFLAMEIAGFQAGRQELPHLTAVKDAVRTGLADCTDLGYDMQQGALLLKLEKPDRTLAFNALSHGQKNMLAIVADLAWRCAVLNPHLGADAARETPGIVLIDEIDLHLHPRWQRRVVGDLKRAFPKVQFIVTTHSPSVIQSLRPGELIKLDGGMRGEYSGKSVEDVLEAAMDIDEPQRSERYLAMAQAAASYHRLLRQAGDADEAERQRLKQDLDALIEPFSDDPAYHAFLRAQRAAAGMDEGT